MPRRVLLCFFCQNGLLHFLAPGPGLGGSEMAPFIQNGKPSHVEISVLGLCKWENKLRVG